MALIQTTHGELDTALLKKTEGTLDDADVHLAWVEYCLASCDGDAHHTRHPDAPGLFCAKHVHRSVGCEVKKGILMEAIAADMGG